MANNIFPNDANPPICTICSENVVDDSTRAITKLKCQHFFHSDCIGSEFNIRGKMICPRCQVVEEDGTWIRFTNSDSEFDANLDSDSDSDSEDEKNNIEDENNEDQPEDENRRFFHIITVEAYTGRTTYMRDPPLPIDGANPVTHERSSLYEMARNNLEPCLGLTLATGGDGRLLPPCQCISCRAS